MKYALSLWIQGFVVASGGRYPTDDVIPQGVAALAREVRSGANMAKGRAARTS